MKAPLSWIKDYVNLDDLNVEQIARYLTMLGLEVEGILLVGLPKPEAERHEFKYEGISWDREKFVVAEVLEVMPHPNADRLVLCRLNDGTQELTILTGAPNFYPTKGKGNSRNRSRLLTPEKAPCSTTDISLGRCSPSSNALSSAAWSPSR